MNKNIQTFSRLFIVFVILFGILISLAIYSESRIKNLQLQIGELVDIAGRQRALTQTINKNALLIVSSGSPTLREKARREFREDFSRMARERNRLLANKKEMLGVFRSRDSVQTIREILDKEFQGLKKNVASFQNAVKTKRGGERLHADSLLVRDLIESNDQYLANSEILLQSLLRGYRKETSRQNMFETAIHLGTLAALILSVLFLYLPMRRNIVIGYKNLQKTNRALEEEADKTKAAEEKLAEARRIAHLGYWEFDHRSGELSWSEEIYKMLGVKPGEFQVSYETFLEMVHPDDREDLKKAYRDSLEKKDPYYIEHRFLLPDGEIKWAAERCETYYDENGAPQRSLGTVIDISERVTMSEDLELYRMMIEKTADPVFLIDIEDNFRMAYVNEAAVKHYGAPREEILTWRIPDWDPNFTYEDLPQHLKDIRSTPGLTIESVHRVKSGEIVPVEVSLNLITYKGRLSHFGYFKNISKRKQNEETLVRAKEEAEKANRYKSDFLSNMSHEIRTPMNAVLGLAYLMKNTELSRKQKDYLYKIEGATRSLLGIINDILDLSRIEAGKLKLESIAFDLNDVMRNLSTVAAASGKDKNVETLFQIGRDVPRELKGDSLRIGQILINLFNNAIKFTDRGEVLIRVDSESAGEDKTLLKFEIHDTGIGMTEEQIERLFQPFTQADASTSRRFGGSGLGLSITRRLLDLMGGTIRVESEHGVGSCFFVEIPLELQNSETNYWAKPAPDLRQLHVLVVDDNKTALTVMHEMLRSFGWNVSAAESGASALEKLRRAETPFDLVLMDIVMPEQNGIETARLMQEMPELKEHFPRIIFMTAQNAESALEQMEKEGFKDVLSKPITPSNLLDGITDVFSQGESSEGREESDPVPYENCFSGSRILVVEDNKLNQQILFELLSDFGAQTTIAENGLVALKTLEETEEPFDLVLMDMQMPEMDGLEASARIRENPRYSRLPIIALTANAMKADQERCLEAGMNDYLSKPIDVDLLHEKMETWLLRVSL